MRPSQMITRESVENALLVLLALGGSTNALIHLTAIAGRRGIAVDLRRLNELSDATPVLVDLKPTGEGYMEDFHAAGGMPALLWELRDLLHLAAIDVTGASLGERLAAAPAFVDRRYYPRPGGTGLAGGRAGGAFRLPRAARGDPEAERGDPCAVRARSPRRGVRRDGGAWAAHRRPGAGGRARGFSPPEEHRARDARPGCRRRGTCRSRRSSRAPG